MNILIVSNSVIPAPLYGGTERVIWDLGHELNLMGHQITYLAKQGSTCPFAKVLIYNSDTPLKDQIPDNIDVVHLNHQPGEEMTKPYVCTQHGNTNDTNYQFDSNTIFVSGNHASRHGSSVFVYNGLNWDNYTKPDLNNVRLHFHFLGKAAWRIKNVKGAISIVRKAKQKLTVMGGTRLNLKMGFRFTPYASIRFAGMVDNSQKGAIMNLSKGLVFPVRWHEPFGLALTESLYYGCPVFGTPYGSLTEIITNDVGFLSSDSKDLVKAIKEVDGFSKQRCHEYARDSFNSKVMAQKYLNQYEKVLNGQVLNERPPQLLEKQEDKFLAFN